MAEIPWEMNELYDSDGSEDGGEEEPILPDWLNGRKEMIFTSDCIVKGGELGRGQYGSVYRGTLFQGQAVYVSTL